MKELGTVRRELGVRTIFNALGPLANPAGATRQLIGVGRPELVRLLADALASLGTERAVVFHSANGLDELVPGVPASGVEVSEGWTRPWRLRSRDPAAGAVEIPQLAGGDARRTTPRCSSAPRGRDGPAARGRALERRRGPRSRGARGRGGRLRAGARRDRQRSSALGFRPDAREEPPAGDGRGGAMTPILDRILADKRARLARGDYAAAPAVPRHGNRRSPFRGVPARARRPHRSPRSSIALPRPGRSCRAPTARSRASRSPTGAGTPRRSRS